MTRKGYNNRRVHRQRKCNARNTRRSHSKPSTSGGYRSMDSDSLRFDLSRMKEPGYMKNVKFDWFIKKLKKKISPSLTLSTDSMKVLDCWMKGVLHQIGTEAATRMGRRKVLKPKILHRALKKLLPKKIRIEAHERGQQALLKYGKSKGKKRGA